MNYKTVETFHMCRMSVIYHSLREKLRSTSFQYPANDCVSVITMQDQQGLLQHQGGTPETTCLLFYLLYIVFEKYRLHFKITVFSLISEKVKWVVYYYHFTDQKLSNKLIQSDPRITQSNFRVCSPNLQIIIDKSLEHIGFGIINYERIKLTV